MTPTARNNPRRAFTLLELLIVIVVIAIVASILFLAGSGLVRRGQARATENTLITLDRVLDVYMIERGAVPPYNPDNYIGTPGDNNALSSGANIPGNHPARPDAAVFLNQAIGYAEVDTLIESIPIEFVRSRLERNGDPVGVEAPSVVDAWAEPGWPDNPNDPDDLFPVQYQQVIYFIHPDNQLAQALYGRCRNERPYFMSAGPDRTYAFINEPYNNIQIEADSASGDLVRKLLQDALDDNIYSTTVDAPVLPDPYTAQAIREWQEN